MVQTGVMKRYRNRHKLYIVNLLKPSLQLTHVAFCLKFWNEHYMAEASDRLKDGHPSLECLAIELPETLNEGESVAAKQASTIACATITCCTITCCIHRLRHHGGMLHCVYAFCVCHGIILAAYIYSVT